MRPLFTLLFIGLHLSLFAQATFSGCVTDEADEPLIGVTITNGVSGTVSDIDGCFSLEAMGDSILLKISFTGYVNQKIIAYPDKPLDVVMQVETEMLEEVVVVGYGRTRKMDRTAAVRPGDGLRDAPAAYVVSKAREDTRRSSIRRESAFSPDTPAPSFSQPAGQLTAGETNDFGKWDLWEDISKEDLAEFRDTWHLYPDNRYAVQITYPNRSPAVDVAIELKDAMGETVWSARTDNRGRAELWWGMQSPKANEQSQLQLVASLSGREYTLPTSYQFKAGLNVLELPVPCDRRTAIDIAFVIDATGSMGDEISYLSSELSDVMARTQEKLKGAELRSAAVFYRDSTDDYVTRHQQFTTVADETVAYINTQSHGGGGDHPEAVDAALETALLKLEWRETAAARLLFLVLDAPPHQEPDNVKRLQAMTTLAAKKGVRIIPIVCSGMTKDGEYLLRSIALATNGTYVFLTDDSGIGGSHLKPTTDSYEVEKLNDLMVRVIHQFSETQECNAELDEDSLVSDKRSNEEIKFRAYPNPTNGPITVKLPGNGGELFVLDMVGKLLRRVPVNSRKQTIQLAGLSSGTYLLRYEDGEKRGTKKVVLTR